MKESNATNRSQRKRTYASIYQPNHRQVPYEEAASKQAEQMDPTVAEESAP